MMYHHISHGLSLLNGAPPIDHAPDTGYSNYEKATAKRNTKSITESRNSCICRFPPSRYPLYLGMPPSFAACPTSFPRILTFSASSERHLPPPFTRSLAKRNSGQIIYSNPHAAPIHICLDSGCHHPHRAPGTMSHLAVK